MDDILIYDNGKEVSRIIPAENMDGIVSVLSGYMAANGNPALFLVYDDNLRASAVILKERLELAGVRVAGSHGLAVSERSKDMDSVLEMASMLLDVDADRSSVMLAVGGGITTDLAGFAAAIYKRGIKFICVPTTLLAQVDASVGGKNGVNFKNFKNMLGVIRQPDLVFLCPEFLATLSGRDFLSGAAEMLKSFLIEDRGFYRRAVSFLSGLDSASDRTGFLTANIRELENLVAAAASVKAGVVTRDQFEKGERRKLNLGHTFAHAIETNARLADMDITHGEAVSMGIVLAAELSEKAGFAARGYADSLRRDFSAAGLPVNSPFTARQLAGAMKKDKKAEGDIIHFVIVSGPGDVRVKDFGIDDVLKMLEEQI